MSETLTLRDFTKEDYSAFAGVESDSPKIGEGSDFVVLVDGSCVQLVYEDEAYSKVTDPFAADLLALAILNAENPRARSMGLGFERIV